MNYEEAKKIQYGSEMDGLLHGDVAGIQRVSERMKYAQGFLEGYSQGAADFKRRVLTRSWHVMTQDEADVLNYFQYWINSLPLAEPEKESKT